MLLIPCPHCGARAEIEFQYGGEVNSRPIDPGTLDDRRWAGYLFDRANVKGPVNEQWWHQHGCRQWFVVVRDTSNNQFMPSENTP